MNESTKRHEENSNMIKEIRASTDAAIRNQGTSIKTLEIQTGQMSKVLQERGFGSLPGSTDTNPRDHVKSISTAVETNMTRRHSRLNDGYYNEEKGSYGLQYLDGYSNRATLLNDSQPQKEKDSGNLMEQSQVSSSSTFTTRLGELAHIKLTVELADRTVKHPKEIAENVLVWIGKFVFPVDFILLDMPKDINVPLILGRSCLYFGMRDVITLRIWDEKIFFKSIKPTSSLIKKVYMLGLRERLDLDLEARLMEETLILNRSFDPLYGDYIKLNDLNEPLDLRINRVDDLEPIVEKCKEEGYVAIKEYKYDDLTRTNEDACHAYQEIFCNVDEGWKIRVFLPALHKKPRRTKTYTLYPGAILLRIQDLLYKKILEDIEHGCYNDNLALMLAPEFDETIRLAQESQSKLNDLIKPFDYQNLNNLNDLFVPQREKEYYYANHMNAILGVYTTLDEHSDLACNYLEALEKCERLENKLSKRIENVNNKSFNELSKRFSELEQHSINLELALQQNLKAQLQDKNIAISELKKLLEKMKGKSMKTKFDKSSVIRQPNAFKSKKQLVLGVILTTSVSSPQLKSTRLEDRVLHNNSQVKTKEVEDHHRNFKSITGNVQQNASLPLGTISRTSNILKSKTLRGSTLSNTPLSSNSFVAHRDNHIHRRLWMLKAHDGESQASSNFVEKFLGTVRFGNDQFAPIIRYGDMVQGNITIKRVYYVKELNHNLFSVDQFCDADLEVAFQKSTCYVHDLKGNDLLTGSRSTDLYSITLQDTTSPNPICLMAKASSSQAWLWHRRLSHLNFDTINLLSKNDIVTGLPKLS
ncbi:retrovirus-related pol polyprotein from transposon TNT 1-94 [Tanacetum coccineum]